MGWINSLLEAAKITACQKLIETESEDYSDAVFVKFKFFRVGENDHKSGSKLKIKISKSTETFADFIGKCPEIITFNSEISLILFSILPAIKIAQSSISNVPFHSELNSYPKITWFLSQIKSRVPLISEITYHNLLMEVLSLLILYYYGNFNKT